MVGVPETSANSQEYGRYAAEKLAKEHVVHEFNDFLTKCRTDLEAIDKVYLSLSGSLSGQPIATTTVPSEDVSLPDLIQSDVEELKRVVLVLAHLVQEMDFLVAESSKFHYPLLYYGEGVDERLLQQGESHVCAGRMTETLQKLLDFVGYCYVVVKTTLYQLSKLYCTSDCGPKYFDVGETHFKIIFERMGSLLATLVTLDIIIDRNGLLREHIAQFQHVVRSVQHNSSSTFDATPDELRLLDLSMDEVRERILSGNLFLRCVSQPFPVGIAKNKSLLDEVSANVGGFLEELSFKLEKSGEADSLENQQKFLNAVCLHVLHAHLGLKVDRKQLKTILDVAKNSIVAVPLPGSCLWLPDQFLALYLPRGDKAVDPKTLENVVSARFQYLKSKSQQLAKEVSAWNSAILLWLTRLGGGNSGSQAELTEQCVQVFQGMRYASKLNALARLVLNLHLAIQPVINKATVLAVFQTFEQIKIIKTAIEKQLNVCPQAWIHLQQQLRGTVLEMVAATLKRATGDTKKPQRTVIAALKMSQGILKGPCTVSRVVAARLSLAICCNALRDEDLGLLAQRLQRMELLSLGVRRRLKDITDCEVFYWHKSLLGTYLAEAGQRHLETDRLSYALLAVNDCRIALGQVQHTSGANELVKQHDAFVQRSLDRHILEPLCAAVETELRIQSHSHLSAGTERNPFKSDFCSLSEQLPGSLPLGGQQRLVVSARVEHYLSQTYYNLAALASHDWRKYGQMRLLAGLVFGLHPLPDRLPSQTLEQGLDILEIMRNIHLFVARFGYNLNNQFFVEQSSASKHLSTIGIKHAANSIRTHGSGVVNTAVNFTYQFLRKKFFVFSQFLYDEHIKSRLMKDARFLRELANDDDDKETAKYPYERAEKFHRGIRKLGLSPTGLSYLDQFRLLVTHLGNALGYVRMLRSGSVHCSAESCAPVPDLAELVNLNESVLERLAGSSSTGSLKNHDTSVELTEGLFESLAKSNPSLSPLTALASRALDKVLDDLAHNLSESSDYFQLLVDAFRPFFRDPRHSHLRHFYLIVPPLTVNYAEHIVTCKEKLNKKNKQGDLIFTDDGLAMGLAYCLSVLDQWKDFDSLQWFASVKQFFAKEREAAGQSAGTRDTLSLTLHRLDTYQQEFDLLFYNVNSARIFFRQDRKSDPLQSSISSV